MKISNHDSDPTMTVLVIDQNELWHLRQAMEQWCKFLKQYQGSPTKEKLSQKAWMNAETLMSDLDKRRNYFLYCSPAE